MGKAGFRFLGFKKMNIVLPSGNSVEIDSPRFVKLRAKRKGKHSKRKGVTVHPLLEFIGFIDKKSINYIDICIKSAVLCPSFELSVNMLESVGMTTNHTTISNLMYTFADHAVNNRSEVIFEESAQNKGLRLLICLDGGRARERRNKKGRIKNENKNHGYYTDWIEPKILTITIVDEKGKPVKTFKPLYDGTVKNADGFFELLKSHLSHFNLKDAKSITFCCDGGCWIWNRIPKLAEELGIKEYNEVIDYTHAKQNLYSIFEIIQPNWTSENKTSKLFSEMKDLLWNGNISKLHEIIKSKVKKKKTQKAALKKLNSYFSEHSRFQYSTYKENGIPIGSGTVESAVRRILNLRIKGPGIFWKRDNLEKIIFLRSVILSGRFEILIANMLKNIYNKLSIIEIEKIECVA
jgi:hypothetical protein